MNKIKPLFSLGKLYVSDFTKIGDIPQNDSVEMKLILEESSGLVRLEETAPLHTMYGKYWYRSGTNNTMKGELKQIVESITNIYTLQEKDIWIDIACNDGTLLGYVPENLIKIGIDPVDDSYKVESEKNADLIIQDYFTSKIFKESSFGNSKAKIITSIAMFYDLKDPTSFINDVYEILDDNGIWVLQLSYTPLMLKQLAFDNICHEHVYYYSLFNLKNLLNRCGFTIMDVQLNDINGGSFRVYVMKDNADVSTFGTQPYRDVCNFRINSLLEYENTLNLDKESTWIKFFEDINSLKHKLVSFIKTEKSKGKTIWAYGASTKGNTLLQYFGLDNTLIDGIAERSMYKFGLKTIGTNIPIFSEEEMRKINPDYLLVLPWHFINEFISREDIFLRNGGKFIVPCPEFKIISR